MFLTIKRAACADHGGGTWTCGVECVGLVPEDRHLVYFTTSAVQGKPQMGFVDAPIVGDHYLARDYDGNVFFEHRVTG